MAKKFLKRHTLHSDTHRFVGRIMDLSIVSTHFENYEELATYPDCKYAIDVNEGLSALIQRVESLNIVGTMLWSEKMPKHSKEFPVSRYEWLIISADVFLARYISVVDCATILVNEIFECGLSFEACSLKNLEKTVIPNEIIAHLKEMTRDQGLLRKERNSRFHHGAERGFSSHDLTFRVGALFEHRFSRWMAGPDGRRLPVERFFRDGLIELQREFNHATRKLVRRLDHLYCMLQPEFESRFSLKFKEGPFARQERA